jgi:hypothetical protein
MQLNGPELPAQDVLGDHPTCLKNLLQIGLRFHMWSIDHGNLFPFNVGSGSGGSREFCAEDANGFDTNAPIHFEILSNELKFPQVLVCPGDPSKRAAASFGNLGQNNVTYRLRTGTNISVQMPRQVFLVCPIDGNTLYSDGTVVPRKREVSSTKGVD